MSQSTTSTPARRPRFKRVANPPTVKITNDDLKIIADVAKYRFLNSPQITRLLPHRSPKKIIERLGPLFHNDYLGRPREQTEHHTSGSHRMVYALGNAGARLLGEHGVVFESDPDWTWKNRTVGRSFIRHTLLTSEVMVAAECVTHRDPSITLIERDEILRKTRHGVSSTTNQPLRLATSTIIDGKKIDLAIIPDQLFGLDFPNDNKRNYFFVEADRATMPIRRSALKTSAIYRKWLGYLAGAGRQNQFGKRLGIGNFRVLTVTTSQARIDNMIDALKELTGGRGSNQFLFTDKATLEAAPDLYAVEWTTGTGATKILSST